ncbi:MAG: tRNA pseudouridine(55) synthase TruB [Eubacteriales bacterium]
MNGVINFLKPPGMSSNHAVGFFKKLLNIKKIGHAGTLDPGACGVLIILVGKATKLSDYMMNKGKTYIGEIAFGVSTDTQDAYGAVTQTDDKIVTQTMLEDVLPSFIGEITQVPSRYSAIKIDGKRAYERARQGENFEIKARRVQIEHIEILAQTAENRFLLSVKCSKGTYIRALFEDIAKAIGTCAYMSFLERTASGALLVEDAVTMDEADARVKCGDINRFLTPIEEVLADYPKAVVEKADFKRVANGLDGRVASVEKSNSCELYRVYCEGVFFGLGRITGNRIKITTHLLGENEND